MNEEVFMMIKKKIGSVRRIMSELEMEVLKKPIDEKDQKFINNVKKAGHDFQVAYLEYTGNLTTNGTS